MRKQSPNETDELISKVYDCALDPARYEELRDSWERLAITDKTRTAANIILSNPEISNHFERVIQILDKLDSAVVKDHVDELLAQFENVSAIIFSSQLLVRAANASACEGFGIQKGVSVKALPIMEEDRLELSRQIARMLSNAAAGPSIFRVRSLQKQRFLIFHMRRMVLEGEGPVVVAATSHLRWPNGFSSLLMEAFEFSRAEVEVVRLLIECCSVKDIAEARGRSIDTVRAQLKTVLLKTETNSQVELIRLVLSMMDMAAITTAEPITPNLVSEGGGKLEALPFYTVTGEDGRRIDYLVLGDRFGKPVLFVTSEYGFCRWPDSAEREAKARGIKIISPMRAGYGYSEIVPKDVDFCEQIARDFLTVIDAENITSLPAITISDDHHFSTMIEKLRPGTITATIATAGGLPFSTENQVERMDKWYRFVQAGARLTPHLLPYIIKMGYHLLRKIGPRAFFRTIYADSKADLETLDDPETMEAILATHDAVFSPSQMGHITFTRQTLFEQEPWLFDHVVWLKGRMPVHFLVGLQDPSQPAETIAEHQLTLDWVDFQIYPEAGQLLLFKYWRDVLNITQRYL